jgi:hypothetical protein
MLPALCFLMPRNSVFLICILTKGGAESLRHHDNEEINSKQIATRQDSLALSTVGPFQFLNCLHIVAVLTARFDIVNSVSRKESLE